MHIERGVINLLSKTQKTIYFNNWLKVGYYIAYEIVLKLMINIYLFNECEWLIIELFW